MGVGCCSSKKRETFVNADELNELEQSNEPRYNLDPTAIMKKLQEAKMFENDQMFEDYIEEHLDDPKKHIDEGGYLTFEYFLKLYKAALVWNRVKFADKK